MHGKGGRRQLSEAKQTLKGGDDERPALGYCQGLRPWLGPYGQETCDNGKGKGGSYANRLLVRSASNAYFPELISAISIPEPIDDVREVITKHLKSFEKITSTGKLDIWLEDYAPDHIKDPLAGRPIGEIFEALEAIRGGEQIPEQTEALKKQELRSLVGAVDGLQRGSGNSRFEAEELVLADKPAWFKQRINRVLKVHQLGEVMALLGFTRLEPVVSQIDGDPLDQELNAQKSTLKKKHGCQPWKSSARESSSVSIPRPSAAGSKVMVLNSTFRDTVMRSRPGTRSTGSLRKSLSGQGALT